MDAVIDVVRDPSQWLPIATPIVLSTVYALAIILLGRWLAGLLTGIAEKGMRKSRLDTTLVNFLGKLVYITLLVFVVIAALNQLGIDTTSAAAVVGAAGLAIGLSLKDQISAFAAGAMLIIFRPFKPGDFVEAAGLSGVIEEINITHTLMRSGDNKQLIVPNNEIWGSAITNYNSKPTRRIDLLIGVSYDADLRQCRTVLEQVIAKQDRILEEPQPVIAVHELGDNSVNFVVRPWVKTADYWDVRWVLTEEIKLALDDANIGIPYPQRDVHLYQH